LLKTPIVIAGIGTVILLVGCSTHKPPLDPISYHQERESALNLIVFIHGFTGDAIQTWTNQESNISWMKLIEDDERLQDFKVMNVGYDTPLRGPSSTIEQIAMRLLGQLKDEGVFDRYKEIYFIAHSMGGLVAKRLLVNLGHPSQVERLSKVRAVLFIATPAQGVEKADWAYLTSGNPQLRDMSPSDYNSYLQMLENEWLQVISERGANGFPRSYCAHETKPTGWGLFSRVIVNRTSAMTHCDNIGMEPVDENHINIVKPLNAQSAIYRWAQARLVETSRSAKINLQTNMSIQLAPRILHYVHRYKIDGKNFRHNEYGFGVVVRARNNGGKIERLRALEITGDIAVDPNDSSWIPDGMTLEEADTEYGRRKPYYRVSFVYYPMNLNKIEPGSEEYIKFMPLDPTSLSTLIISRGAEGSKYIGYNGSDPASPVYLTTVPNIHSFVKFMISKPDPAGNAILQAPRLREEIKSGKLKFALKFESGSYLIDPQRIASPALMSLERWDKQIPQDIYFKNNSFDRSAPPMEQDPLIESFP
jgi:pimeloyl-ACP methyl ester carboxylesterase